MNELIQLVENPEGFDWDHVERVSLAQPQVDLPVTHMFKDGVYIRQIELKAGCWIIGLHQNFEHECIFVKGKMLLRTPDGKVDMIEAPMHFISPPGRKVAIVYEDIIFQNIYHINERDVETLEAYLLTKSDICQEDRFNKYVLGYTQREEDREDYNKSMLLLGFTEPQVQDLVNIDNVIDWPDGSYKVKLGTSPIHGRGVMATANINIGEVIGIARLGDNRTPLGRYTNHSKNPNAKMMKDGDNLNLVAIHDIKGCQGGYDGEEVTISYYETIKMLKE